MKDPIKEFNKEKIASIKKMIKDKVILDSVYNFLVASVKHKYSYNFSWLGRPIIQYPQDIVLIQELIWQIKPDLIIETGIAHGGSLTLSASILELIGNRGLVVGVDIDIRKHNRREIEKHPLYKRIKMFEGSSTDEQILMKIKKIAEKRKRVMVFLDSMHSHDHVLNELRLYSPWVTKGSYLVVFDTLIEDLPADFYPNRPWGKGNNPETAVNTFLKENKNFIRDKDITEKLLITVAKNGFLKKIK